MSIWCAGTPARVSLRGSPAQAARGSGPARRYARDVLDALAEAFRAD